MSRWLKPSAHEKSKKKLWEKIHSSPFGQLFPKRNFHPCFFMEVFKPPFKMKCLFVAWL